MCNNDRNCRNFLLLIVYHPLSVVVYNQALVLVLCQFLFSKWVTVLAASVQNKCLFFSSNPAPFIIALVFPNIVANDHSTTPFCCGVPGAVYSKIIPKSFSIHKSSSARFSPALSHPMCSIFMPYVCCSYLRNGTKLSFTSDFCF